MVGHLDKGIIIDLQLGYQDASPLLVNIKTLQEKVNEDCIGGPDGQGLGQG